MSVQQVRNYEAFGLLPPVSRSKSGYRLYTQQHLAALKTTRSLVAGYGWQRTPKIMQALHRGELAAALATIDARHAELARKRQDCEQTLSALHSLAEQLPPEQSSHSPQRLRVGEAARQVGVRVSALHFWEQHGLLHSVRDQSSRYRLYDEQQMRRLRVFSEEGPRQFSRIVEENAICSSSTTNNAFGQGLGVSRNAAPTVLKHSRSIP
jgi:DNA-binding transcriptional MerR regulator